MWTYTAKDGEYIPGVPARDLTDAEAKQYGVEDSPIYEKASPKGDSKESPVAPVEGK